MKRKITGNVFHKFTRQTLKANRTRTLVTIIGIILSMALFTAVIEGAYSGIMYIRKAIEETEGAWQGELFGLSGEALEEASRDSGIKDIAYWQQVGWAETGSTNEYKPFLLIESVSDNFTDLAYINIKEGRMPENSGEIILPDHLRSNGGVEYHVGDVLNLDVGRRVYTDSESGTNEEVELGSGISFDEVSMEDGSKLSDTVPMTFTVTGIYERLDWRLEAYSCPGFTALTVDAEPAAAAFADRSEMSDDAMLYAAGELNGEYRLLFTFSNPRDFMLYLNSQTISSEWTYHNDLLATYGISGNSGINRTIVALVIILVILIAFGSVTLIYNSFSISVSERTRQFGILKSVGATKKQIRHAVIYEAFLLSVAGILIGAVIGCVGIGITLRALNGFFAKLLVGDGRVTMRIIINPVMLLIAAGICFITVMISAWIPARRAIRVSAIESIRQSNDVKIKGRQVRTSRLTAKLFGFEGMMASKNFKRNRKRVRSVVISLFLSLILFITASSFTSYLKDSIDMYSYEDSGYDIYIRGFYGADNALNGADNDQFQSEISALAGVDEVRYNVYYNSDLFLKSDIAGEDAEKNPYLSYITGDYAAIGGTIQFVNDDVFRDIVRSEGLDEREFFDPEKPMAISYTKSTIGYYNEETNSIRYRQANAISEGVKQFSARRFDVEGYIEKGDKEYVLSRIEIDGTGNPHALYTELMRHFNSEDGSQEWGVDPEETELLPAGSIGEINLESYVANGEKDYYIEQGGLNMVYPVSMVSAIYPEWKETGTPPATFYIRAQNHTTAAESINRYIDEHGLKDEVSMYDLAEEKETERMLVMVINVFSYGFIILISLIAAANIFNTISTNVTLRRREFAMLKSIGLSQRGFQKMMNYECMIYGLKGLLWGLPASVLMTYIIYRAVGASVDTHFYIPWQSIVIAVGSVFVVIFAAMWYAAGKIRRDNPIDALKNENI